MAKIWPVHDGSPSTLGRPWAELPLDEAIRVLDLEVDAVLANLPDGPELEDEPRNLALAGYAHVVVEVGDGEVKPDWKPGWYRSPLSPAEASLRLQVHQRLGENWRDEWKKGEDADGEPAIWLWAVLRAEAPDAEWAGVNREAIRTAVREIAAESGVRDWVYVRFRKESDERDAS